MNHAFLGHAFNPIEFCKSLGITPDDWQARVLNSSAKHIILLCSRQSGKSLTAQLLALWTCTFQPNSLVLVVSSSLRQSLEMFRGVLNLLSKTKDHGALIEETKQACTLSNGSRIISLPSSESTIRGYAKANLIIIDEAAQVEDPVYYSARPMLSVSNGRLMLLSTPCGCTGFFWDTWQHGENWEKIRITAEECPRISEEFLAEERLALGDLWYRQEYNTEFLSDGQSVFPAELVNEAFVDWLEPLYEEERCSS